MYRSSKVARLLLTTAVAVCSAAGGDIVDQAVVGQNAVPFEGKRISVFWTSAGQWATVTREFCDGRGRSRVEYLNPNNLRGHVMVFDGRFHWHRIPQRNVVIRSDVGSPCWGARSRLRLLRRNYDILNSRSPEFIGGIPCLSVELQPKSRKKPVQKMWIDPVTGFVLKVEKYRPDGSLVSVSHFLSIALGGTPAESLFSVRPRLHERLLRPADNAAMRTVDEIRGECGERVLVPARLSGDFVLENACSITGSNVSSQLSLHYTDGLSNLSLVQSVTEPDSFSIFPFAIRQSSVTGPDMWGPQAPVPTIRWSLGNRHFALLGDVPSELLEEIARGLGGSPGSDQMIRGDSTNLSRIALLLIFALLLLSAVFLLIAYARERRLKVQ
ncbi:MAG: hypothetical protein AUJ92_09050 [Armatimonadetes bacterium CG2_30_59_28]|nr:MAG: hypothetical protein AUJ92_09050 [Armatimonadetes bacterium CG2_30_59_28]PIU60766.1 MAG: hypothetical protein COS85_22920 [Armatimonadetes bacterium CG07_land_8_20_14_0_80_59_28]PIY48607.1 MAG: hypothetical protein COZ05_02740 [Armatimonadetes bacterium CG_4_10_14_3_um_filter_59_10]